MEIDNDSNGNNEKSSWHQHSFTLPSQSTRRSPFQIPPKSLLTQSRRGSSGMFISSMFSSRFRHLQRLHTESFLGLNAVCLPVLPLGAVFRSSLPATPVATPVHRGPFEQFSEEVFRERLCKTPSPRKNRLPVIFSDSSSPGLNMATDTSHDDTSHDMDQPMDIVSPTSPIRETISEVTREEESFQPECSHASASPRESQQDTRLFVGNISYRVKEYELKRFFIQFGKVKQCTIIQDHIQKRSKGFGFITIDYEAGQKLLDKSNPIVLNNRELRIFPAHSGTAKGRTKSIEKAKEERLAETKLRESATLDNSAMINTEAKNINDLNDYTLMYIFDLVDNIIDKTKFERVCVRWRSLVLKSWNIQSKLTGETFATDFYAPPLTTNVLFCILKKCPNLKCLDLQGVTRDLDHTAFSIIGNACPLLESINYSEGRITDHMISSLGEKCRNLKIVNLDSCYGFGEKALWYLIKDCQELEEINIKGNIRVNGNCFRLLSKSIKNLDLRECKSIRKKGFTELVNGQRDNLTTLKVSHINSEILQMICSKLTNLKHLVIELDAQEEFMSQEGTDFTLLRSLVNLETLECLNFTNIHDYALIQVIKHCNKLQILKLPGYKFTDYSIAQLPRFCPNLQKLCIKASQITDDGIYKLVNLNELNHLDVSDCKEITDNGIKGLITECIDLTFLNLNGCERITIDLFDYAMKLLKENPSKCDLFVAINGIRADLRKIHDPYQELNWSKDYMEEDFYENETISDVNSDDDFFENDDPAMKADRELS